MTASKDPSNKLLPCPFCGARARFEIDDDGWEWVECSGCGIQGNRSASLMEGCKPKLAEAWNRRAQVVPNGYRLQPLSEYEAMCAFVAAAPQPPEALKRENPATKPEAAPVQLPEPVAAESRFTSFSGDRWRWCTVEHARAFGKDNGYEVRYLYTEHQVRQLLAQHGIE